MAVRDNDHGCPTPVDLFQKSHDLHRIVGIQVSCRLIGKQDLRTVDQSPGDRHSLLFSAGKLVREKLIFGRKTYHLQHLRNRFPDRPAGLSDHSLGKCHILINCLIF